MFYRRLCLAMVFLNLVGASGVAYADMQVRSGAPEGFEQMDAPRATRVTLSYGGDVLGSFPAHFSPGYLQFDQPEAIVAAIPAILNPPKMMAALRQPLPAHADRLCDDRHREGCGNLSPDDIGVIFDETRLCAELFINKNELAVIDDETKRYLPLPERRFSSVDMVNGAITGTDSAAPTYALTNQAVYSYGEMKLDTETTTSNQGLRFDTAAASIERQGWAGAGGLFRSRAMQLLSDRDIGGVSLSSSTRTLLDEHKTEGNDVLVYLPRRSFVSILREGRLYSSHSYEAGNQYIDTSELPDGAYDITLRIQEADGQTREERRFFAKSRQLPPPGTPVYYAQLGMIRKSAASDATLPQLTANPIARVGTVRRIDDNLGFGLGGLGLRDRAMLEPSLFWLGPGMQASAALLASTRGDKGVQIGGLYNRDNISASADARQLWLSAKPLPGFDDMAQKITQATASISYAFTAAASLGLRISYAQQSGSATTASIGPYADWRLWQEGENTMEVTADAARTGRQYEGSAFLRFSHRFGDYGITTTAGGNFGGASAGPAGNARIWHDDPTPGNALQLGAGISGDQRARVASGDADWRNHFGQLRGSVQEAVGQGQSTFGYGGNFAFNVAQQGGELHVGGDQQDSSAVVIETTGDAATAMKIYVNGMARSTVTVGDRQVLYLSPFHSYSIRLAPVRNGLLDYDANERKLTLYPGNVVKLAWTVHVFYVVAAKIVTSDGQPLKNAILQESRAQVTTDERGHLQTELSKPETLTFESADGGHCRVTLPSIKPVNGVMLYHKALVCRVIS